MGDCGVTRTEEPLQSVCIDPRFLHELSETRNIAQEQDPGGLLHIVQLIGNAFLGAEDLFNGIEGVFVHGRPIL